MTSISEETTLGGQFARALAAKDYDQLRALLHPEIDFRAMTPRRFWEASDPDTIVDEIVQTWFDASDEIDSLDALETDEIADAQRVGYRFSVHNPEGRFTVEQQAYLTERDGRIGWMRVMCTGFRPLDQS